MLLPGLVQAHGALAHVEKDEVLRLVRHEGAEVAAHNAVPRGAVLAVEMQLYIIRVQETNCVVSDIT